MTAEAQFRALGWVDLGTQHRAALQLEAQGAGGAHADGAFVDLLDPGMVGLQRQVGQVDVAFSRAAEGELRLGDGGGANDLTAIGGEADLAD